jgi:hypothetical protein
VKHTGNDYRTAQVLGMKTTEYMDRRARGMGYCWSCHQWKRMDEFGRDKLGHKRRVCLACRPEEHPSTVVEAERSAARWTAPPAAIKAAREFLSLMDVPEGWQVPK